MQKDMNTLYLYYEEYKFNSNNMNIESESKHDMRTPVAIGIVAVAVIILGGWYYYQKGTPAPHIPARNNLENKMITVRLDPLNGSGQMGTAFLRQKDKVEYLDINVLNAPANDLQPAHIHRGKCPNPDEVIYSLNASQKGVSGTLLDTSLEQILDKLPLAINIHTSSYESEIYTACGDILEVGVVPER